MTVHEDTSHGSHKIDILGRGITPSKEEEKEEAKSRIDILNRGIVETVQTQAQAQPEPKEELSFFEGVGEFFSGSRRKTEATETLPEIGGVSTGKVAKDIQIAAGLLTSLNPEAQMDIISNALPGTEFSKDEKGNTIVSFPNGERSILNKPGASFQDAIQLTAQALAFVPSAKIASLGKGILTKLGLGGGAAGVTDVTLQEVSQELGSEQPFDPVQTGLTTVLGGAAELAGPALTGGKRLLTGAKAPPGDALASNARLVDVAEEASQRTGIDLFPAQKTLITSELETQSFVASLPGGAQPAMKALEKQNLQAFKATQEFLEAVAPAEVVATGAKRFKSAAEDAILKQRVIRKEAASPLYKQAARRQREGNQPPVDTSAIELKAFKIAEQFSFEGEIGKSLKSFSRKMEESQGSIAKLHNLKIEIDQKIAKVGENSLGNTTKKFLTTIQKDLTDALTAQSPSYRVAREAFIRESPAVQELIEGAVGKAAKVADVDLKRMSAGIFDAAETNPLIIRKVRAVIDDIDPGAYDDLMRVEFERRIGSMNVTQAAVENIPGQVRRALFGNEKQRRIIFNALRPEQSQTAMFLETALRRASIGRPGGSQTATREEIKREINQGGVSGAIRAFLNIDLTKPGRALTGIGEGARIQERARVISELVYNPSYQSSIKGLRDLEKTNRLLANKQMRDLLSVIRGEITAVPRQTGGLPEVNE